MIDLNFNRAERDRGFTLVELLVYMLLLGIVGTMVAMLIVNGFRSQTRITETTARSGEAQNAAAALEYDIRYAIDLEVAIDGSMVRTRTFVGSGPTGSWQCRGWYFDASSNELRRSTDADAVRSGVATDWARYADSVQAITPFRKGAPDADTGSWDQSKSAVAISFTGVPAQWGVGTKIDTVVNQRPQTDQGEGGEVSCF